MNDLISREDAIKEAYTITIDGESFDVVQVETLQGLPSAQPEIIRCKDCIYYDAYVDGIEKYQWDGFCSNWARNTYEDWYCSRADMRGENR